MYSDGGILGAFRIQNLYPMLMSKLKARGLHFLVPPFNASAQAGRLVPTFQRAF
jgi:hypothetical protein